MKTLTILNSVMISMALASNASFAETVTKDETNNVLKVSEKSDSLQAVENVKSTDTLVKPIIENVILPLYKDAAEKSELLNKSTLAFCEQPTTETLNELRKQWSLALSAWQATEISLFGPALEKQRDLHIYFRPVKKRVIKILWASDKPITLEAVNFAGVGAKGFATLEYLLFDRSLTDSEILARFDQPESTAHCQHLLAVSILLKDDINTIANAWATGYPAELIASGEEISLILGKVNQTVQGVETKLRHALAIDAFLAGKDDKRENRNAHKLEAWRSGHTLQNIHANLLGVTLTLCEGGFINWLNDNNQSELADKISKQLTAVDAISFTSDDLFQQVEDGKLDAGDALFKESMQLFRLIKELALAMDIQLGFNNNDGD
ncbi:imelysin family protein [Leucothrix arctica]|uniref:Imelysin-like domain-containing protein n=1 Tax=Leucothrix arctica TaxID=1481894 RepID=A0A317C6G3_9GAMM|nr:imelysin family protein [Leucothrix arctica]PWQ94226.1 hypothetical protein DKT75_16970 [Leucothrix arctica]